MTDRSKLKAIGGSTIAGILGLSPWESPYSLYLKMTGEMQEQSETEAMSRGKALEPVVAMMYGGNHQEYTVESMPPIFHADYPYLVGSPDRILLDSNGELVAGLEIKTANIATRDEWGSEDSEEIPVHYFVQCLWYCGLLNVPVWYLAVGFVPAERRKIISYREYEVRYNEEMFQKMLNRAIQFWTEYVEKRVPPPITVPTDATIRYLRSKYPFHEPGKWMESTEETDRLVTKLIQLRKEFAKAELAFELQKTRIISMLGNAEGVSTPFGKITYKTTNPSRKTDWKAVAEEMKPRRELIERFTTETPGSRRFLIQESKK